MSTASAQCSMVDSESTVGTPRQASRGKSPTPQSPQYSRAGSESRAGTPQPAPRGVLSSVQSSPQIGGSQQEAWLDAQISKAYNAGFQRGASHASDPVSENMPPVRLDLLESRGCSPVAERKRTPPPSYVRSATPRGSTTPRKGSRPARSVTPSASARSVTPRGGSVAGYSYPVAVPRGEGYSYPVAVPRGDGDVTPRGNTMLTPRGCPYYSPVAPGGRARTPPPRGGRARTPPPRGNLTPRSTTPRGSETSGAWR